MTIKHVRHTCTDRELEYAQSHSHGNGVEKGCCLSSVDSQHADGWQRNSLAAWLGASSQYELDHAKESPVSCGVDGGPIISRQCWCVSCVLSLLLLRVVQSCGAIAAEGKPQTPVSDTMSSARVEEWSYRSSDANGHRGSKDVLDIAVTYLPARDHATSGLDTIESLPCCVSIACIQIEGAESSTQISSRSELPEVSGAVLPRGDCMPPPKKLKTIHHHPLPQGGEVGRVEVMVSAPLGDTEIDESSKR